MRSVIAAVRATEPFRAGISCEVADAPHVVKVRQQQSEPNRAEFSPR